MEAETTPQAVTTAGQRALAAQMTQTSLSVAPQLIHVQMDHGVTYGVTNSHLNLTVSLKSLKED